MVVLEVKFPGGRMMVMMTTRTVRKVVNLMLKRLLMKHDVERFI